MYRSIQHALGCLFLLALGACSSIPPDERPARRADIDAAAASTVEQLKALDPDFAAELDGAVGYLAGRLSSVSAPVVGGGGGLGVLVDLDLARRTYVNLSRFDFSVAAGAQTYRVLVVFDDREVMESFRSGRWQAGAAAEVVAGTTGGSSVVGRADGFSVRVLTENGAVAGVNLRLVRISVNHDLTDTGISEITIPNRGFEVADGQEDGPRQWDRLLPFMAQNVVDKGFDLPLPLGTGLTYAYTDQEQLVSDLEIGLGGRETVPINFVTFEEVFSQSNTTQGRFDAWLLPFMNVFGMIGRVSGTAPVLITLDGDQALEDLIDNGLIDCEPSGFPPVTPPLCSILPGGSVTFPIDANFEGITYGLGTTLAVGWNGWFGTLPIVFTYADMEDSRTEGVVTTITPRVGRLVGLGRAGNLAIFGGGQYIDSQLDVEGTFFFGDSGAFVDYKIKQQNKDRWNLLIGGNWDINKHWSASLEYSGFIGSREGVVASVGLRF